MDAVIEQERVPFGDDPPTREFLRANGTLRAQEWRRTKIEHSGRGSSSVAWNFSKKVHYRPDGRVSHEEWFLNEYLHRLGAPARTVFDYRGQVYAERFAYRGQTSRLDGPAIRERRSSRSTEWDEEWVLRDERVPRETFGEQVRSLSEVDLRLGIEAAPSYSALLREGIEMAVISTGIRGGLFTAESIRTYAQGAPLEWVLAFESGASV